MNIYNGEQYEVPLELYTLVIPFLPENWAPGMWAGMEGAEMVITSVDLKNKSITLNLKKPVVIVDDREEPQDSISSGLALLATQNLSHFNITPAAKLKIVTQLLYPTDENGNPCPPLITSDEAKNLLGIPSDLSLEDAISGVSSVKRGPIETL